MLLCVLITCFRIVNQFRNNGKIIRFSRFFHRLSKGFYSVTFINYSTTNKVTVHIYVNNNTYMIIIWLNVLLIGKISQTTFYLYLKDMSLYVNEAKNHVENLVLFPNR